MKRLVIAIVMLLSYHVSFSQIDDLYAIPKPGKNVKITQGDYLIAASNNFAFGYVFGGVSAITIAIPAIINDPGSAKTFSIVSAGSAAVGVGFAIAGIINLNRAGKVANQRITFVPTNNLGIGLAIKL